jgi:Tfp pilus assembly protein PilF
MGISQGSKHRSTVATLLQPLARRVAVALLLGCSVVACTRSPRAVPLRAIELQVRGARALAEGDLRAAQSNYEVALEYDPNMVEALVGMALVYRQQGDLKSARELLVRATRVAPEFPEAYRDLGLIELDAKNYAAAEGAFQETLALDPSDNIARRGLIVALDLTGRTAAARVERKRLHAFVAALGTSRTH